MFAGTVVTDLLAEVRGHDFGAGPVSGCGASRIDAIAAIDPVVRAAQAEQCAQIVALHAEPEGPGRAHPPDLPAAGRGVRDPPRPAGG